MKLPALIPVLLTRAAVPLVASWLAACDPVGSPERPGPEFGRVANVTTQDLGTLGGSFSQAVAVNASGVVAGLSTVTAGSAGCGGGAPVCHAFVWTRGTLRDLGTLGGSFSQAIAINDAGQVAGNSTTRTGHSCPHGGVVDLGCHAFLWDGRTMRDLGTLGGDFSEATALTPTGRVAGFSITGSGALHGFFWDGAMHDLGTLGGPTSIAYAVDAAGRVTGASTTPSGPFCGVPVAGCHAFSWNRGTMRDLGTLGGAHSTALAINPAGLITGTSTLASGVAHGFLWDGAMHDLGTLGGDFSEGTAINSQGQVAGFSNTTLGVIGNPHAFLWDRGTLRDLGTLGGVDSYATAIGERGQVIGSSAAASATCTGRGPCHAFLWTAGVMHDLGTLGGSFSSALAQNQRGQVAGWSETGDLSGAVHATLWTVNP